MGSLRETHAGKAENPTFQALSLDEKSARFLDVLGLAYAKQGRIGPAFNSLDQAVRLAPAEEMILKHYLQVRDLVNDKARLENIPKKEKSNEKTS